MCIITNKTVSYSKVVIFRVVERRKRIAIDRPSRDQVFGKYISAPQETRRGLASRAFRDMRVTEDCDVKVEVNVKS